MKRALILCLVGAVSLACAVMPQRGKSTVTEAPPGLALLTEVLAQSENCRSQSGDKVEVMAGADGASFSCSNSADTSYGISVTRYDSADAARAQFETARGANPIQCFHGYDLYEVTSQHPSNQYIVQEQLGWQAGNWLVSADTSYDYGYFHYTAMGFAEKIYTVGVESGLFSAGTCP